MSSWWLVPIVAMAVAAIAGAVGVRRLRAASAGLTDDADALAAIGSNAAALGRDVAALQDRLDRFPGADGAGGGR